MRIFLGLTPTPEVVGWILRHKPLFLPAGARWLPPEQWHITLVFIGERPAEAVELLHAAIEPLLQGHPAILIQPSHIGWQKHTLWVHLHRSNVLEELVRQLHQALGLAFQAPFLPHITIARSKHPLFWEAPPPEERPTFILTTAYLYQSVLKPTGAEYYPLKRYLFDISPPR